jgi:ribulose-phosphate 3-epimerase
MRSVLKVSPSIAAGNLMQLEAEVRKLEMSGADSIHFDVMDGHFVPLLTIGIPFIEQMRKLTDMHLDVHIMVTNPDKVYIDYLNAGADTLSFHIEAAVHAHRICTKIKEANKKAGVVLNPATHWRDIEYLLQDIDQVTIMSVNPGFSRQKHLTFVHKKINELNRYREENQLKFLIQVDGGVTHENSELLYNLGVDIVVAGGAVFNYDNYKEAIDRIKNV